MTDKLKRLWAPWRSGFLKKGPARSCFICFARRSSKDHQLHVVARSSHSIAILNLYPYNNGHVMVAPYRHVGGLERLNAEEWADIWKLSSQLIRRLRQSIHPHGFNLGVNIGRAAGAGVPGHIHFHIVPRWNGDTNFMPVLSGTKVVSQSLDELYRLLVQRPGRRHA